MRNRASLLFPMWAVGCHSIPPPASPIPSGEEAITRMRETVACGQGVQADAKVDYFGDKGRRRGNVLMLLSRPASMRMEASAFGSTVFTLTSDGKDFGFLDFQNKQFLHGPASACNIARMTHVNVPGPVLVDLLRGEPPVLKHTEKSGLVWDTSGYYVVSLVGANQTSEEVRLAVHPDDREKNWTQQRLRLLDVKMVQAGVTLYHADLEGHKAAPMWKGEAPDPALEAIGESSPTASGPQCTAELPRIIHVEVPTTGEDVIFRYDQVVWNPALGTGVFVQASPPGTAGEYVNCNF